ncbi:sporulation protein YunB [Wukongibacter baidiensis]|uniref:sporulation protein YunB n=1 Tax=Wukongibacter baidiensis TaxID=1723361 RepID=UPI003D7FAD41
MFARQKYKKGMNNNRRLFAYTYIVMIIILLLVIYGFMLVDKKIKPTVLTIAEIKAKQIASKAINESISKKITDDIRYQDLYFIRTDSEGNITFMQSNTIMMNNLAADVALEVQQRMKEIGTQEETMIRIPLGNIFESQILAQYGPKIKVEVTTIGRVNVDFYTEFEQSGINQTRHKIYLTVNAQVKTIIPFTSKTMPVQSTVPIAETIIVGKVPANYVNVPKEDLLNVVPEGEDNK